MLNEKCQKIVSDIRFDIYILQSFLLNNETFSSEHKESMQLVARDILSKLSEVVIYA